MTRKLREWKKVDLISKTAPFVIILISLLMMFCGGWLKEGVKYGIDISFGNIIPTIFPFFILSDLWCSYIVIKKESPLSKSFQRIFSIEPAVLSAYLSGLVCGFPIGIKTAVSLYNGGFLTKSGLERTIGAVNNPSFAFVVFGVGAGLYGNVKYGLLLYISVIISSILVFLIFKAKNAESTFSNEIIRQSFSFVDSIKNAGFSSITVSSFIIFFSSLIFLLKTIFPAPSFGIIVSSLLEVGNAVSIIADNRDWFGIFTPSVSAFALGFSGLSVHMQCFALLPKEISKRTYLSMKLTEGLICATLVYIFTLIKNG